VDSSYVSRRIEKITYDEQGAILQEAAALDTQFFEHGGGDGAAWMCERARVIAAGVRRAGAMIAEEARTLATEEAPEFAAEAGTWIGRLSARLVSRHRQQLMSRKGQATSAEVEEACNQLADDAAHGGQRCDRWPHLHTNALDNARPALRPGDQRGHPSRSGWQGCHPKQK
jgi:hypothetical protein